MFELVNCPVCLHEADWMFTDEITKLSIYFCMNCCEHFTEFDSVTKLIKTAEKTSNIIDEDFIEYYNRKL